MTGSAADPLDWQQHIRNKPRREALARRFKDPDDPFKLVIVRDMWLTGFDAPSLHTMYVDKPMRGHGLMQAIARVNRVFRDKQGGLVVDYLGIADQLKRALADYTDSGGRGDPVIDQAQAVAVMLEKYEVVCDMLYGFEFTPRLGRWHAGAEAAAHRRRPRSSCSARRRQAALRRRGDRSRKAFSLAVPHDETARDPRRRRLLPDGARAAHEVEPGSGAKTDEELDLAVRQIVSRAVVPEVWRHLRRPGGEHPDISVLDDSFLAEVRDMPRRNLAVELLREAAARRDQDALPPQPRRVAALLGDAAERRHPVPEPGHHVGAGHRGAHQARQGAAEAAHDRGEKLGLSEDEVAFYDALETNDTAVPCSATRHSSRSRRSWSRR